MSPKSWVEWGDELARERWARACRRRWDIPPRLWDTLLHLHRAGPASCRGVAGHFGCTYNAAWTRLNRLRGTWVSCKDGQWSVMEHRKTDLDAASPEGVTVGKLLAIMPPEDL